MNINLDDLFHVYNRLNQEAEGGQANFLDLKKEIDEQLAVIEVTPGTAAIFKRISDLLLIQKTMTSINASSPEAIQRGIQTMAFYDGQLYLAMQFLNATNPKSSTTK